MEEQSGGSGDSFGFVYDTDKWKIKEFQTMENAYALCEFIGNTFFRNFFFHCIQFGYFLQQIEIFNVISIINFGKLPIAIGYKMKSKLKLLGWDTILIKNL